ncbi:integral membrane protein [Colletotrichum incanum]|uniref:Integral membrane protein n=1 Tax=Colletotrichum incanum TaxID=1573173 RepID=A0A166LI88_COLIC|nr:integral membrane protein [Colletotrichum incanum]OHW92559.1 integral membrane protein [Colletotrichum incanum]
MDPQSQTLAPLPDVLHRGLTAVSFFGFLSFVSTTALFFVLTYRLVAWYLSPAPGRPQRMAEEPNADAVLAEEMGLPETMYSAGSKKNSTKRDAPNQFLMLIYNLLLADIQQALAFLLNASWLSRNAIVVESTTCWAQGWFISTGDLASSAFITTIAVHTYLSVVRDYKLPTWAFWTMVGSVWFFIYALAVAGIIITNNGAADGGLYVRAAAWCWVNVRYEAMRLYLHYLWMFVSFFITAILYILIFNHIRRTDPSLQLPSSSNNTTSSAPKSNRGRRLSHTHTRSQSGPPKSSHGEPPAATPSNAGHHPAFLIYPIIYILCTAPLAMGRVITMAGKQVSLEYFCLAGAMIASNGWLDVLLFSTTRHVIIFNASPDYEETGLETFAFMRTPANRRYGNMVWVQGAGSTPHNLTSDEGTGGWLWKLFRKGRRGSDTKRDRHRSGAHRSISQESLRRRGGNMEGIQMETVTTVVVEVEGQPGGKKANDRSHSIDTIEKERAQSVGSM